MSYASHSNLATVSIASDPPQRWAVVGGGILGMALAHRLAQAGQRVTLFEAADELGGLASAWQFADTMWDRHYHVTLLSDLQLRSLLGELNLDQKMVWRKTKTGVYADGQLYSVSNAVEFLQFPALGWLDKFRLALTIWYGSKLKDGAKLEQISVVDWLRRWSGDRTFQKFWLPLLRAKLGSNYRKASAAFIWATIARLYAARSAGLKEELFGYLPGGYHRLLSEFARLLQQEGVEICLGHRARQIYSTRRTLDRSAAAVAPSAHPSAHPSANPSANPVAIEFANGAQRTFDQVVVTTAAPIAAQLIGELSDAEQARLNAIEYQGIVCASVLLKKPLSDYYVTNITDDGLPFTGVIEMTTLVDRREFAGLDGTPRSLVYLPKYVPSEDAALQQSDEAVRRSFLAGLERLYPAFHPTDVLDFRLSRVKYVMAVPTLNYSQQIPPIHTSVPGLHLVNSSQIVNATLNVNDTLKLVERSLPQLLTSVCTPS